MSAEQKNVKQADVKHVNVEQRNMKQADVEQRNMKQADVKPVNMEQRNVSQMDVKQMTAEQRNMSQMDVKQRNVNQMDVKQTTAEQRNVSQRNVQQKPAEQGNCSECRDWLPLYYAKSSTTSQNVQWMQHLLVCPDCRKEAGEMLAFARLVKEPLTLPKEVEVHAFDMIDFSEAGEAKTKKTLHRLFGISSLQESAGVVWKTLKVVPDKLSPLKEATQLAFRCCSVRGNS